MAHVGSLLFPQNPVRFPEFSSEWQQHAPLTDDRLVAFNTPSKRGMKTISGTVLAQGKDGIATITYKFDEALDGIWVDESRYRVAEGLGGLLICDSAPNHLLVTDRNGNFTDTGLRPQHESMVLGLFATAVAEKFHIRQARTVMPIVL